MGNMVLMAVRHRNLDEVAKLSLKEIGYGMHRTDHMPKCFDRNEAWLSEFEKGYAPSFDNVLVSNYYHASARRMMYVDDKMMVGIQALDWRSNSIEPGPFELAPFMDGIKRFLKAQHKHSILSREGKLSRSQRTGDKVSLFMLFTDCIDRAETNPQTMAKVVRFCEEGVSFGSYNDGIVSLTTIDPSVGVFVELADYSAKLLPSPRFDVEISEDEWTSMIECYRAERQGKAYDAYQLCLIREIAAARGYLVKPTAGRVKSTV